jgi:hypothetical protein
MSRGQVARVAAIIARAGKIVTLRRLTGTQRVSFGVELKAVVRQAQPNELVAGLAEFGRIAICGNAEIVARQWPGPPKKGDELVVGGKTLAVLAVETRHIGEDQALHVMAVEG